MKLIIDLGDRKVEESHASEEQARSHLSIVLDSHKARGHRVAQRPVVATNEWHYIVHTPEGSLQYWLEK